MDVADQRRPGQERHYAVNSGGQGRGRAGREGEPVGHAAAGEGEVANVGVPREQAQRAFEPAHAGLVGGDLLGASNATPIFCMTFSPTAAGSQMACGIAQERRRICVGRQSNVVVLPEPGVSWINLLNQRYQGPEQRSRTLLKLP
jgi:hypothetical protein